MLRAHAHPKQELMEGYDERDAPTRKVEFAIVPEAFLYFARALRNTEEVMAGLEVHPDRMAENLEHFGMLVASEAVMMELAGKLGRQTAHDTVYEHAMTAIEEDRDLVGSLREDERVTDTLSKRTLEEISNPAAYTGLLAELSRRTVENSPAE